MIIDATRTQCAECQNYFAISQSDWQQCPLCSCLTYEPVLVGTKPLIPWRCKCGHVDFLVPADHITVGYAPAVFGLPEYTFHAVTECVTHSTHM